MAGSSAGFEGDGTQATGAQLNLPRRLAALPAGAVAVADDGNRRLRLIDAGGLISTIAGNGEASFSGDGGPATAARFASPSDAVRTDDGTLYVADTGNHRIRMVAPSGTVTTFAGTGVAGNTGDAGPRTAAQLSSPTGVAVDPGNNVYISDSGNHRIRRCTASGALTIFTPSAVATAGYVEGNRNFARFDNPGAVHLFGATLLIADLNNHRIRRVQ